MNLQWVSAVFFRGCEHSTRPAAYTLLSSPGGKAGSKTSKHWEKHCAKHWQLLGSLRTKALQTKDMPPCFPFKTFRIRMILVSMQKRFQALSTIGLGVGVEQHSTVWNSGCFEGTSPLHVFKRIWLALFDVRFHKGQQLDTEEPAWQKLQWKTQRGG